MKPLSSPLERLRLLLAALNASDRQLRRDECADWRIRGTRGHVYADGPDFLLVVDVRSARRWSSAKVRLAFCQVTQDGDDEGCMKLDRLPDPTEAEMIRATLGLRKRKEFSAEELARLKLQGAKLRGAFLVLDCADGPEPIEDTPEVLQ